MYIFKMLHRFSLLCGAVGTKTGKYILTAWLALLLLLGNTPMDFIHQFANHTDTVHTPHKGLVIENKHHHCAFLSLTLASFVNDFQLPYVFFSTREYFIRHAALTSHFVQRSIVAVALRGPPVHVVI